MEGLILVQEHPDADCLEIGHDVSRVMVPEHAEDAGLDPGEGVPDDVERPVERPVGRATKFPVMTQASLLDVTDDIMSKSSLTRANRRISKN
jgi:hypothetical protein